jgi:ACS family glucarate transporter-like MFS transporter
MSTQAVAGKDRVHFRRGWIYVLMLALVTVNYIDRSALSVVARDVASEFKLSPVQMGYLFSSFFWSYVICLLPVGIMLDRFGARNVNSAGITLWSLAVAATAGVWSFSSLILVRLVMGAGEATSIPACGRIVREWMPARERGIASTIYSAGTFLGPAIGAVVVASITSMWGWRAAFVVLGALGFVWLACNLAWFDQPERVNWLSPEERQKIVTERGVAACEDIEARGNAAVVFELLRSPSMWGALIVQAAGIYTLYLLLFWMPTYLQTTKNLTDIRTGVYTAVPWAIAVPLSIGLAALSDWLLTREGLLAGKRRIAVVGCVLLAAVVLLVPFTNDTSVILALFAVSLSGISATISLNLALVTDLVHRPRDVGKALSLTVLSGNGCGLLAPIVTGYVVAGLGKYDWAFGVAGILLLVGAVAVGTMTRNVILPRDDAMAPQPMTSR